MLHVPASCHAYLDDNVHRLPPLELEDAAALHVLLVTPVGQECMRSV